HHDLLSFPTRRSSDLGFGGPGGGFVGVTGRAGIRDFVLVCHGRGDEGESVSANFDVRNGGPHLRHVAGNALASGRAGLVMGVLRSEEHTSELQSPYDL